MPSTRIMSTCRWRCMVCKHTDEGTYYFLPMDAHKNEHSCSACGGVSEANMGGNIRQPAFPFTSTHIDGKGTPITIESYRHLQQTESKYGVAIMNSSEESPKTPPRMREFER